jgi:hypothetical protein
MTSAMHALKAHVEGGRLVFDEPTDLPEGAEVEIAVVAQHGARPHGHHVRVAVDETDEPVVLSPEENAKRWADWVTNGPQGPIEIDSDDGFPDEG